MVRGMWIVGVVAACSGAPRPHEPTAPVTPISVESPRDDSALVTRPSQLPAEPAPATAEEIRIVTSNNPPAPGAAKLPMVVDEPVAAPVKRCDGRAAVEQARDQLAMGNPAAAVVVLQRAYACDPQPATLRILFIASCKAKRYELAKRYFPKLPASEQPRFAQLCMPPSFASAE